MRSRFFMLLAFALAAVLALFSVGTAQAVTTTKTQITYIVSPHPDDVFQDWAVVQNSSANYPVFITLTNGESTSYCNTRTIDVPGYGSYNVSTEDGCKRARKASLNSFLSNMTHVDSYLDTVSGMTGYNITSPASSNDSGAPWGSPLRSCNPGGVGTALDCTGVNPSVGHTVPFNANDNTTPNGWHLLVGPNSARAEFDMGDGNLTEAEVRWAIAAVRARVGIELPNLKEYEIFGSYANTSTSSAYEYYHHDHKAVHNALWTGGFGIPALAATYLTDPDADAFNSYPYTGGNGTNSGRQITSTVYTAAMKYNTSGARDGGYFQQAFSWLTGNGNYVNGVGQNWSQCANVMGQSGNAIFCQQLALWKR